MKLLNYFVREDYGNEYCLTVLQFKRWSLIQTSVSWSDDACSPMMQFTIGCNGLLSFWVYGHKFSFCFDLITLNWHRDT
jgi:hypothetical protein